MILYESYSCASLEKSVTKKRSENDLNHRAMSSNFDDSLAFQAVLNLVFQRKPQPKGYFEPLLYEL